MTLKCGHTSPLECTRDCERYHDTEPDPPQDRDWARYWIRRIKREKNPAYRKQLKNLREYLRTGMYPRVEA